MNESWIGIFSCRRVQNLVRRKIKNNKQILQTDFMHVSEAYPQNEAGNLLFLVLFASLNYTTILRFNDEMSESGAIF